VIALAEWRGSWGETLGIRGDPPVWESGERLLTWFVNVPQRIECNAGGTSLWRRN
jgi:hypothetical protein